MKLKRDGRKKRELRNLIKRGTIWYFKMMVDGRVKFISLDTEDLELAKSKRDAEESKALAKEWDKIKGPRALKAGTLEEVFAVYKKLGGITTKALRANPSSLMCLVRWALAKPDLEPKDVSLEMLTKRLVRDYQDNVRKAYESEPGPDGKPMDDKAKRQARDRADRTSKSTFNQAKSVFCKERDMIQRYKDAGIGVPDCVQAFATAAAVGTMTSKVYFPPSDAQIKETFQRVEELRESEVGRLEEAYRMFWCALATGCRRNELADMRAADLVELDGRLWVGAGLGKDGLPIRIPVITWRVHPASRVTPDQVLREVLEECRAEGREFLFRGARKERYAEMPDALNRWMTSLGWTDEKKLHGLRAFIGCKLYLKNPRLAQFYMRHKSIKTTEDFYSHFLTLHGAFEFGEVAPAPSVPQLAIVQASGG